MPAHQFPRRTVSASATIAVVSLPSWLPTPGSWGAVSLNTAESIKGNFTFFTSSRNWNGPNGLWDDFSGAVWNPHLGSYGGMMFHGGGHATNSGMADNGVYAWLADDRQWRRLVDPTYPGDAPAGDWVFGVNEPYSYSGLNNFGELTPQVPASNHSRWLPCILPPSAGGSASGDFIVPFQAAIHTGGQSLGVARGHRLNVASALSLGSANANPAWSRFAVANNGARGWAATVDTARGLVYCSHASPSYLLERYSVSAGTMTTVTPSGFVNDTIAGLPLQYAPEHDLLIIMTSGFSLRLMDASAGTLSMITPTITGTAPSGGAPSAGSGGGFAWCPHLGSYGAVVHYNYSNHVVKACYAPASPLSGTWNWVTLSASNTPSGRGDAIHWYNRFQYAPALKSFFLCSMPNDSYGGIVCFRPSEIP